MAFMIPINRACGLGFLCALLVLGSCRRDQGSDAEETFSLTRLTPEERQAEILALLESDESSLTGSGDFFDPTIQIDEEGIPAAEGCRPDFVAQRWRPEQYRANGFTPSTEQCGRNKPPANLKQRESIPIYWLNLSALRQNASGDSVGWSDDIAGTKMREAIEWFAGNCIELDVKKVDPAANRLAMDAAIGGRPYQGEVVTVAGVAESVNNQLYERELRKPRKYLLVLFTDAFQNVRFGGPDSRVNRVAGNFEAIPVILVPDPPDARSTNIITHELIHGLGKVLIGRHSFAYLQAMPELGNPSAERISLNRQATWDEGGCAFDMGNAGRTDQDAPLAKPNSDLMDWASFWQFDQNGNTRVK